MALRVFAMAGVRGFARITLRVSDEILTKDMDK